MWENFGKKKSDDDMFSGTAMSLRCYESHPVIKLGKGKLYGGSASHPKVKDADIYVALQSGSTSGRVSDPWDEQKVVEIHYGISDMTAPNNVPRFKKLVTWLCTQLQNGKTVHVGCIGGHGRTGTLISAIVAEMKEKKDAIQWVRKHYCKKAVESRSQVQFLMKHYGVTDATPTKGGGNGVVREWPVSKAAGYLKSDDAPRPALLKAGTDSKRVVKTVVPEGASSKSKSFSPMSASSRSIWRRRKA